MCGTFVLFLSDYSPQRGTATFYFVFYIGKSFYGVLLKVDFASYLYYRKI